MIQIRIMEELRRENERLRQENQELRELLKQVTERLIAAEQKCEIHVNLIRNRL